MTTIPGELRIIYRACTILERIKPLIGFTIGALLHQEDSINILIIEKGNIMILQKSFNLLTGRIL